MMGWHDFFSAQVGASAALVGLLFVALSINVAQILKYPALPPRAAQTLVVLTGALVESSLVLVPAGPGGGLYLALALCAGLTWLLSLRLHFYFVRGLHQQLHGPVPRTWTYGYFALAQITTLPALAGAVSLYLGGASGLYWIAGGVLLTFVFALLNSWILLIEILR
jgi:hypothetical protein